MNDLLEQLIKLLGLEMTLALYSLFLLLAWNWAFTQKPINFWVAFSIIHIIRFIGQQFRK